MNKSAYLRNQLNLSQEEMAMVLGTTRSQLSLYELGLRELSTSALVKYSQIGLFLATPETPQANDAPPSNEQLLQHEKFLTKALKENQYQQTTVARKTDRANEAYAAALKLSKLIDFLDKPSNDALHPGAVLLLRDKLEKALKQHGPEQLLELKLRMQLLQHEEIVLSQLLKDIQKTRGIS